MTVRRWFRRCGWCGWPVLQWFTSRSFHARCWLAEHGHVQGFALRGLAVLLLLSTFAGGSVRAPRRDTKNPFGHSRRADLGFRTTNAVWYDTEETMSGGPCARMRLPRLESAPLPLLDTEGAVRISYIIGRDGAVEQVMVLGSVGLSERAILDTMRSWRFRPATCNGVPMNAEGLVEITN